MKEIVYIIIALIGQISLQAQTLSDAIDYSAIVENNVYQLKKVTEGKSNTTIKLKPYLGTTMFIIDPTRTKPQFPVFTNKKIPVNENDTIMYLEFDLENQNELFYGHQWAIMHLNRKANVIILDKISFVTQKHLKRLFKIIKLTTTEIILKDISNVKLNRVYYLVKR
jgi:hypothetical protein